MCVNTYICVYRPQVCVCVLCRVEAAALWQQLSPALGFSWCSKCHNTSHRFLGESPPGCASKVSVLARQKLRARDSSEKLLKYGQEFLLSAWRAVAKEALCYYQDKMQHRCAERRGAAQWQEEEKKKEKGRGWLEARFIEWVKLKFIKSENYQGVKLLKFFVLQS